MNTSKRFTFLIFFLAALLTSLEAKAHFMWLNVDDYSLTEDNTAKFSVGWGHCFYNPVGSLLMDQKIIKGLTMTGPDGQEITVEKKNDILYQSVDKLTKGSYLVLVQRQEGFSTKTKRGYKRQSKKGLEGVIHSRYIGMYGKAIINVGEAAASEVVTKPMGVKLELVPLIDPASLEEGDYFTFKLLADGEPVAEYIYSTYVGFSTEDDWAYTTRTNKKGIGKIKILRSGIWVLKANHKLPYPDPEEANQYSYTTSLSFEVR